MNKSEVISLLKANKNERGIENWKKLCRDSGLDSFGIGLTQLRKLAKKIGRDHDLAMQLWDSKIYDAKVIALLIDVPRAITLEQAEMQVEQLEGGYLAHVFSSCDATLAKTSFANELADKWVKSDDPIRKSCGFGLLYEASKSKKKDAPDDEFFLKQIALIESTFQNEPYSVRGAMGGALIGIGKRNLTLNKAALKLAKSLEYESCAELLTDASKLRYMSLILKPKEARLNPASKPKDSTSPILLRKSSTLAFG